MSYVIQRQDRFYVVAYDGLDPLTGRERRRWHPVGHAHPAFTMHTYQHLLPGMSAAAADRFATMITTAGR